MTIPPAPARGCISTATRAGGGGVDTRPDEVDAAGRRGGGGSSGKNLAVGVLIDSQQVHFPPRRQLHGFNSRVTVRTNNAEERPQLVSPAGRQAVTCGGFRVLKSQAHLRWVLCGRAPRVHVSRRRLRGRWGVCVRRVPLPEGWTAGGVNHRLVRYGEMGTDVERPSLCSRIWCALL